MGEKEVVKTSIFFGAMCALVLAAYFAQPRTRNDLGPAELGPFFPELTDIEKPKAMEIAEYDEKLDKPNLFKVAKINGAWVIPSHSNYPADAEDRLKKTAAALYGLRRDSVQSMNKDDHEAMGVADPTEPSSIKGTGKLVKLFDESNNLLAALIVGKELKDRPGFRFMRTPESPVVYSVDAKDLELTARFSEWINTKMFETNLDFDRITQKDYKVVGPRLEDKGTVVLQKDASGDFLVQGVGVEEETNKDKAREISTAIGDLKIVGVRKKPSGLTPNLRTLEGVFQSEEMQELGFIPARGTVYSQEGEVIAETKDGIVLTIRFGGLSLETGEALTAGKKGEKAAKPEDVNKKQAAKTDKKDGKATADPHEDATAKSEESRYALISVTFDKSKFPEIPDLPPETADAPPAQAKEFSAKADAKTNAKGADKKAETKPEDIAKKKEEEKKRKAEDRKRQEEELKAQRNDREQKLKAAEKQALEMQKRYDEWYYVVPNDAFKKIRLSRADLVGPKKPKTEGMPDFSIPNSPLDKPKTPPAPPANDKAGKNASKESNGNVAPKTPGKSPEVSKAPADAKKDSTKPESSKMLKPAEKNAAPSKPAPGTPPAKSAEPKKK